MSSGKGCAVFGGLAVMTAFMLALLLLFAIVDPFSSSASASTNPGANASAAVPAAYRSWVQKAGGECAAVSAPLIAAQIDQESNWNPNAVSPSGAQGIAQFMPSTWRTWGRDDDGTGNVSPLNPDDAIMAMGRYDCAIAAALAHVPGDPTSNMLAGYNAGVGAVKRYDGVPPYTQTTEYVASIEALVTKYETASPSENNASFARSEIAAAEHYIGTPYVWGGGTTTGPTLGGFDCSGLVLYAVYQASDGKIKLPHSSELQATMGTAVSPAALEPGDVIAIQTEGPGDYSHIVIYAGGGRILEAPRPGELVRTAPLREYTGKVMTIRRFG